MCLFLSEKGDRGGRSCYINCAVKRNKFLMVSQVFLFMYFDRRGAAREQRAANFSCAAGALS